MEKHGSYKTFTKQVQEMRIHLVSKGQKHVAKMPILRQFRSRVCRHRYGVIALIVIGAVIFGANKKETPTEAPSTPPEITKETTSLEHQTMQLEPESEQAATTTNIADVPDDTGQVEENIRTPALTNKCASENESKPEECSSVECAGKASDSAKCESERAPKNELY